MVYLETAPAHCGNVCIMGAAIHHNDTLRYPVVELYFHMHNEKITVPTDKPRQNGTSNV